MRKIDRLGWAAGLSFTTYGVRIGVRANNPKVFDHLVNYLPPGWKLTSAPVVDRLYSLMLGGAGVRPGTRRFNLLYGDLARLVRSLNDDDLYEAFEADLKLYVAEMARRRVFVHAGVVGWRGQAIVIPGHSFSGKSTLVAELVRAGATYYSDEYAVLDARGNVHPYARPLSIRGEATAKKAKRLSAEDLGGAPGIKPLPVGLVVVSEYKAGKSWKPRRITTGRGLLALLANTVSARRQPENALSVLQQVAMSANFVKGVRGEAGDAATSILKYHAD